MVSLLLITFVVRRTFTLLVIEKGGSLITVIEITHRLRGSVSIIITGRLQSPYF